MEIKGLKKAVGDYRRLNKGGAFDPWYGYLMYDTSDGNLWTDEFYSIGHNTWKQYHSPTVVNIGKMMTQDGIEINMKNVKEFIASRFSKDMEA